MKSKIANDKRIYAIKILKEVLKDMVKQVDCLPHETLTDKMGDLREEIAK